MKKKIIGLFVFLFVLGRLVAAEDTVFSYRYTGSDDTCAMMISEENTALIYSDAISAEAIVVYAGDKDFDKLKAAAFECKVIAKQAQSLREYKSLGVFNAISSKLFALGREKKVSYGEVDGYMKITEVFTTEFIAEYGSDAVVSGNINKRPRKSNELEVWSFTDELDGMITKYFQEDSRYKGKYEIDYSLTPVGQFPDKLDPVLASGSGCPDVFALEDAFVRKYVESGLLLDLTNIYNETKDKMIKYPAEVGMYNGRVYALSWQTTPGALFYRRSLAKKYLGTDDPKIVQKYLCNWDKFLETAELLKNKSNGNCYIVSSTGDLFKPFLSGRKDPWVVNNKLVIDPNAIEYMEMCKTLKERGLEGRVGQWSEGWFDGMKGNLCDVYGDTKEVFSYFLPTWGLHYVLKLNSPETSGDWAMCAGPSAYYWGGTWIGAWAKTKNPRGVKELIKYLTTDDTFLESWARDTGDSVSNFKVVDHIKDSFSESFLGGQNSYGEFAEMAKAVNGKLSQGTDQAIEIIFDEAVGSYVNGEKTMDQAITDFKEQCAAQLSLDY
ncbi:MAG: extracellular solute-binding protein [Spirochaetales bacterium]|nr:extracellular solute-binding protein [Spirochaetales bacterium]